MEAGELYTRVLPLQFLIKTTQIQQLLLLSFQKTITYLLSSVLESMMKIDNRQL